MIGTLWSSQPAAPSAGETDGVTGLNKPEPNKLGVASESSLPPRAGDADGVTGLYKPEPNKFGVGGEFGGTRLFISVDFRFFAIFTKKKILIYFLLSRLILPG